MHESRRTNGPVGASCGFTALHTLTLSDLRDTHKEFAVQQTLLRCRTLPLLGCCLPLPLLMLCRCCRAADSASPRLLKVWPAQMSAV